MRHISVATLRRSTLALAVGAALSFGTSAQAQQANTTFDGLLEKLKDKGVLTQEEYDALKAARDEEVQQQRVERRQRALKEAQSAEEQAKQKEVAAKATKFDVNPGIKSMQVFGDVRLRYESRAASSPFAAGVGFSPAGMTNVDEDRWRYAARIGIRGDLTDDWFYGVRLETGSNNRSTWVTFGGDTDLSNRGVGPSNKSQDSVNIGQVYLGWRTTPWLTLVAGKQPNPFYTSVMVWDPDIQPEALAEKVSFKLNDQLELFGNFAQIVYKDNTPDGGSVGFHSTDGLMFGFQGGATYKVAPETNLKAAITYYGYSNVNRNESNGSGNNVFIGLGPPPGAASGEYYQHQNGINNLAVLQIPWEVNFPALGRTMRVFGDFATNLQGDERAQKAYQACLLRAAAVTGRPCAQSGVQSGNNAYQLGIAYGNLGLVYGSTSKKGTWEVRTYFQRIEQYALDPNLIDSDFFEGRTNLQGIYVAGAYSFTDSIIGTLRYGYASQIDKSIPGTGGSNPDLPWLNPITSYNLLQFDLTWRF
jgi:hypothetical protein